MTHGKARYKELNNPEYLSQARKVNKGLAVSGIYPLTEVISVLQKEAPYFIPFLNKAINHDVNRISILRRVEIIVKDELANNRYCEVLSISTINTDEVLLKIVPIIKVAWYHEDKRHF